MSQLRDGVMEQTAARFVAKICAGEMSEGDQLALEEWLAENPRHLDEYEALLDTWDAVGNCVAPGGAVAPARLMEPARAATFLPRKIQYRFAAGVAALAIAVGAATVGWNHYLLDRATPVAYETLVGERKTVDLADGSTVTLNTATRLLVDFSERKRRLVLSSGEAFFDIAAVPSMPLTVEAGDRLISVIGTAFDVHRDDAAVAVAVMQGLVSVDRVADANDSSAARDPITKQPARAAVLLRPGSGAKFSINSNEMTPLSTRAIERSQDWRSGVATFDNEPMGDVIAELNRYNARKIVIADAALTDMPVSGVFRLDDIEHLLHGIESALSVHVTRQDDQYVIVGRNPEAASRAVELPAADR